MTIRTWPDRRMLIGVLLLATSAAALAIWWRFETDMQTARSRIAKGSIVIETRCGPIEYQETGSGIPMLSVHGSGGGFDQGMAFAAGLVGQGVRIIAMSRFGYLRTPLPVDASAEAQADAHVCLLDALGIKRVAVLGGSAGAPSALQMAIRHPDRVSALILLVPLTYKPPDVAGSAPPLPAWIENTMMTALGSDFLFWTAQHVARNQLIWTVLATPPELLASASPTERARIEAMLDNILPVSARGGIAQRHGSQQAFGASAARKHHRSDADIQRTRRRLRHLCECAVHSRPDTGSKVRRLRARRPHLGRAQRRCDDRDFEAACRR